MRGGTPRRPQRLLIKQVGIPLLEVGAANNFQQIREITRQVGRAVAEEAKAEALLAQMDKTLAQLAASAPPRPIRIVVFDGAGSVYGKGQSGRCHHHGRGCHEHFRANRAANAATSESSSC
ncbi:MAG: hypothetical protein WDM77_11635 [Steroidobacteraceae bacterium]